jgi:hypothetical protein
MFGKKSEVYVNGSPYAADKIKKARYGKSYVSMVDAVRASAGELPLPHTEQEGANVARRAWNSSFPTNPRRNRCLHPCITWDGYPLEQFASLATVREAIATWIT